MRTHSEEANPAKSSRLPLTHARPVGRITPYSCSPVPGVVRISDIVGIASRASEGVARRRRSQLSPRPGPAYSPPSRRLASRARVRQPLRSRLWPNHRSDLTSPNPGRRNSCPQTTGPRTQPRSLDKPQGTSSPRNPRPETATQLRKPTAITSGPGLWIEAKNWSASYNRITNSAKRKISKNTYRLSVPTRQISNQKSGSL